MRIHTDLSHICDKSSERFEPRQTTVCRLTPHVPNRKLKPPQMRRFEFSGRIQIPRPVAHTKSAKTHTPCNKKQGKTGNFCKKRTF